MASNSQSVNTTFTKEDSELYKWVKSQGKFKPLSWVGREAFKALKTLREKYGDNWEEALKND